MYSSKSHMWWLRPSVLNPQPTVSEAPIASNIHENDIPNWFKLRQQVDLGVNDRITIEEVSNAHAFHWQLPPHFNRYPFEGRHSSYCIRAALLFRCWVSGPNGACLFGFPGDVYGLQLHFQLSSTCLLLLVSPRLDTLRMMV